MSAALAIGCGDDEGITGNTASMSGTDSGTASNSNSNSNSETDGTDSTAGPGSDSMTESSGSNSNSNSNSNTNTDTETESDTETATDSDSIGSTSEASMTSGNPNELMINCGNPIMGALNAGYNHTFEASGGTPGYKWTAEGLPAGLVLGLNTGEIAGIAEEKGSFEVEVTVTDSQNAMGVTFCTIDIDDALGIDFDGPCIEQGDTMLNYITGGGDLPIDCQNAGGNGGGKMPSGLQLNPETCVADGTVTETTYGTWAWVVRGSQGLSEVYAPYCATQPMQSPNAYPITGVHSGGNELDPALATFTPGEPVKFDGDGEPFFQVQGCNGPPCYHRTIAFFTASPLGNGECANDADGCFGLCPLVPDGNEPDGDTQLQCSVINGFLGLEHELWAKGNAPPASLEDRVWVAHYSIHYCQADNPQFCDEDDLELFKMKGQSTNLEFSVIMNPE